MCWNVTPITIEISNQAKGWACIKWDTHCSYYVGILWVKEPPIVELTWPCQCIPLLSKVDPFNFLMRVLILKPKKNYATSIDNKRSAPNTSIIIFLLSFLNSLFWGTMVSPQGSWVLMGKFSPYMPQLSIELRYKVILYLIKLREFSRISGIWPMFSALNLASQYF